MGSCEGTGDVIAVSRSILHDQERRGGSDALLRHLPGVVREDIAVGEAQEQGWDIAVRRGGVNDRDDNVAQWARPFLRVKEGINHFYVINKTVEEMETFEEFTKRFNAGLIRLGEAVHMIAMELKRRETT